MVDVVLLGRGPRPADLHPGSRPVSVARSAARRRVSTDNDGGGRPPFADETLENRRRWKYSAMQKNKNILRA